VMVTPNLENGASITCSARIVCDEGPSFATNTTRNTVSFTSDLGAQLEVLPAGEVAPGDILTCILTYRNHGNGRASEVTLWGELPQHTTYLPGSTKLNGLPLQDKEGTSPLLAEEGTGIGDVAPGTCGWASLRVQVGSPLPSGTSIASEYSLACHETPRRSSNRVESRVVSSPDFGGGEGSLLQSYPHETLEPGQVATFVLYFRNIGNANAEVLRIRGRLPQHTSYVSGSTRVDGMTAADVDGASPLFQKDGIVLHQVHVGKWGNVSFQANVDDDVPRGAVVQAEMVLSSGPPAATSSVASPPLTIALKP